MRGWLLRQLASSHGFGAHTDISTSYQLASGKNKTDIRKTKLAGAAPPLTADANANALPLATLDAGEGTKTKSASDASAIEVAGSCISTILLSLSLLLLLLLQQLTL
eukprot:scaffold242649_cov29-Tisochrysis_lutea.AAC.1